MGLQFDVVKAKKCRPILVVLSGCLLAALGNSIRVRAMLPDADSTHQAIEIAILTTMNIIFLFGILKIHSGTAFWWSVAGVTCSASLLFAVRSTKGENHVP